MKQTYQKTGMKSADNSVEMFIESAWNESSAKAGMLRIDIGGKKVVVKAMDMISNMMVHSGEEESRYMSDGLMTKTKKKHIIDYPFSVVLKRNHVAGETMDCTVQLTVPEELKEASYIERKNVVHEGKGNNIISAPKNSGKIIVPMGSK